MGSQEISFDRYNSLQKEVWKHNDIQSALKEAYELIKWVVIEKEKNRKDPVKFKELEELQNKFIKEYSELEKSIRESMIWDKSISKQEREKIMYELSDIVDLAQKNWIKEHKNLWSKVWDIKRSIWWDQKVDTDKAKNEAIKLDEKKELITKYFKKEKFSDTELKKLLTISNEERKSKWEYKTWNDAWKVARLFGLDSTSADVFLSQEEVIRTNQFQDDIIKRIWFTKWYNSSWDIHAFHPSMWNYITNVPIVESALKTNKVQNLWGIALKNYLWFLENKRELTTKNLKTKFWEEKTQEIFNFIKSNPTDPNIKEWNNKEWKPIFSDDFLKKITDLFDNALKALKEKINWLFNKLAISKDLKEFQNNLQEIRNYDEEEKTELVKKFDTEIKNKESALKKLFFEPVKAKLIKNWKTEAEANIEAEKITNEVLNKIESNISVSNLDKVFKIIEDFNKKYESTISPKKAAWDAVEVLWLKGKKKATEYTILAEEARKNWDNESARKYEQNAKSSILRASEAQNIWKIINNTSEQEASDIWTWKLDYKKHLEKILSKDESLRKEINNLEAEKKKLETENWVNNNKDTINEKTNLNPLFNTWNSQYNPESWTAKIWEKEIVLSKEENILIKNNPETFKNIVDFYSTLNKVWLAKLWTIKEQIFNVIWSIKWVWFRIDQNYLSENETKIFLNSILKSTWEETINPILGINDFTASIEKKNNNQFSWAEAQVNKAWDTKIEQKFISSFAPRWWIIWFNSKAFEEKIRG